MLVYAYHMSFLSRERVLVYVRERKRERERGREREEITERREIEKELRES